MKMSGAKMVIESLHQEGVEVAIWIPRWCHYERL